MNCCRVSSKWYSKSSLRLSAFRSLQESLIIRHFSLRSERQPKQHFVALSPFLHRTFSSSGYANKFILSSHQLVYKFPSIRRIQTVSYRYFSDEESSKRPEFSKKKSPLPLMLISMAALSGIVVLAYVFSDFQKKRIEKERKENMEQSKPKVSKGKALIGGPFTLVNTEGETVTDKDFLGKWLLVYFGFTFCPDICPEELEKIGEIIELINSQPSAPDIQPIFISVDPKRDTPELIKSYLADFHPKFIGLTGTTEQIKRATKSYRVYYSEGPDQAPGAMEYIVDHSIVTFLVDPRGDFCKNFGQKSTAEDAATQIAEKMNEFYLEE